MSSCDIIIPVWNQLELTERCIESVEKNTLHPYRLIIVDNASGPESAAYLEAAHKRLKGRSLLIKNAKNQGFIKAVNKGLLASKAKFICVLNNDTIVTQGWLGEMIRLFDLDPGIGIVNPSSNSLGQKLPKGVSPDSYAAGIIHQSGRYANIGSALGFCMLMKRSLFGEIGKLDEIYGTGNFDDTDLSMRAKREGYKTVRACASYVYHKEQGSFNILKTFKRDFKINREIFEARWGKVKRVIVVFSDTTPDSIARLKEILKEREKERSWVYVISPDFEKEELFTKFSNMTFYHYGKAFFYVRALIKTAFKKKKPDIIYSDSELFLSAKRAFNIHPNAKTKRFTISR